MYVPVPWFLGRKPSRMLCGMRPGRPRVVHAPAEQPSDPKTNISIVLYHRILSYEWMDHVQHSKSLSSSSLTREDEH